MALLVIFMTYPRELFRKNKESCFLFLWTLAFWAYLALGAKIFMKLEGPHEEASNVAILKTVENVKSKYTGISDEAIKDLFHQLSATGVKGLPDGASPESKWTFGNAFLFCFTLVTTVGYGHLSPWTYWGKLFTMLYTSIGIPMTLVFMALYVCKLKEASQSYKITLFRALKKYLAIEHINFIHISTLMILIFVGCFLLPAWVYIQFEDSWNYLDALYFCFISLTTVGLGDLVPGLNSHDPHADLYRIGSAIYMLYGIIVLMFMLSLSSEFYNHRHEEVVIPVSVHAEKTPVNQLEVPSYGAVTSVTVQLPEDDHQPLLNS